VTASDLRKWKKYRKKPVVIEAIQWLGDNEYEVSQFAGDHLRHGESPDYLLINTLEGTMKADLGDWIIRGIQGEIYPCKPDIFEATYEPVGTPPADKRDELLRRAKEIMSFGMYADTMQQWLTDYNRLMGEEAKTDE